MQKIKVGDKVFVISGKLNSSKKENKDKVATVLAVDTAKGKVKIDILSRKKFKKRNHEGPGEITEINPWISLSNVAIIDPKENVPTRVGIKINKDGSKVRIAKKSGTVLDK
jgi:large subunit ribosomal protein L24